MAMSLMVYLLPGLPHHSHSSIPDDIPSPRISFVFQTQSINCVPTTFVRPLDLRSNFNSVALPPPPPPPLYCDYRRSPDTLCSNIVLRHATSILFLLSMNSCRLPEDPELVRTAKSSRYAELLEPLIHTSCHQFRSTSLSFSTLD